MTPKSSRLAGMVAVAAALIILFARPIGDLARLSFSSDLYSYIPMVPLISVFLIWTGRRALPSGFIPAPRLALIPLSTGLLFLASYGWARSGGWKPELSDYLALMTVSLILLLASGCLFVLGKATLRAIAFPAAFLFLAAPIPSDLTQRLFGPDDCLVDPAAGIGLPLRPRKGDPSCDRIPSGVPFSCRAHPFAVARLDRAVSPARVG